MDTPVYSGVVTGYDKAQRYAFISKDSVSLGAVAIALETDGDIFVHQDDMVGSTKLRDGMAVTFSLEPDTKRIGRKFRARAVMEIFEGELLPPDEAPIPGLPVRMPLRMVPAQPITALTLRKNRLPVHLNMKDVPLAEVDKALENRPLGEIVSAINSDQLVDDDLGSQILATLFPVLAPFGADFAIVDASDETLDLKVGKSIEEYRALGMQGQEDTLKREVAQFKNMRETIRFCRDSGLVRRDTLIPMRYLPDLFMACPVWYWALPPDSNRAIQETWVHHDPQPSERTKFICDLVPNERWRNTFQMFNRRLRNLAMYDGELIPPAVAVMLRSAMQAFDQVVIATPYHDRAGKDWTDLQWLRAIDPFVLGFKKGLPFFVVLARYSGSGVYPLLPELVADTIQFLRDNKNKLQNFGGETGQGNPYWYVVPDPGNRSLAKAGQVLTKLANDLITAFEQGILFDWLRGDTDLANMPAKR